MRLNVNLTITLINEDNRSYRYECVSYGDPYKSFWHCCHSGSCVKPNWLNSFCIGAF
jgi:hypothetical protein